MAGYREIVQAWYNAGAPQNMDGVHDVLMQFMEHSQAQEAFKQIGMNLPDSKPEEHVEDDAPIEDAPREIPVGYTIHNKAGDEIVWRGAQWVSKGQIVPKKFREKVDAAAYRQMDREEAETQAQKQSVIDAKAEKQRIKDEKQAERYSFDDEPDDVVEPVEDEVPADEPEAREPKASENSDPLARAAKYNEPISQRTPEAPEAATVSTNVAMKELAMRIKSTGEAERIKDLLSKSSNVHDLAASLILSGQAEEAKVKLQG